MHSIIICPKVRIEDERLVGEYDLDNIKRLLLYWDELNLISYVHAPIERDQHLNHLKSEGALKFINVAGGLAPSDSITGEQFTGMPRDMSFRQLQAEIHYDVFLKTIFSERANTKGKILGFEEPAWGMRIPFAGQTAAPVLQMTLQSCLPNPSPNASFDDILRFKDQRSYELNRLRNTIEDFVRQIQSANEPLREENSAIMELKHALGELQRVSSEKAFLSRAFGDLRLTQVAGAAASALAIAGVGASMPFVIGAGVSFAVMEAFIYTGMKDTDLGELNCYKYIKNIAKM